MSPDYYTSINCARTRNQEDPFPARFLIFLNRSAARILLDFGHWLFIFGHLGRWQTVKGGQPEKVLCFAIVQVAGS